MMAPLLRFRKAVAVLASITTPSGRIRRTNGGKPCTAVLTETVSRLRLELTDTA